MSVSSAHQGRGIGTSLTPPTPAPTPTQVRVAHDSALSRLIFRQEALRCGGGVRGGRWVQLGGADDRQHHGQGPGSVRQRGLWRGLRPQGALCPCCCLSLSVPALSICCWFSSAANLVGRDRHQRLGVRQASGLKSSTDLSALSPQRGAVSSPSVPSVGASSTAFFLPAHIPHQIRPGV